MVLYGIFNNRFSASVSQKRLELKSIKGQTKAEKLGARFCRENLRETAEPRVHRGGTDPLLS